MSELQAHYEMMRTGCWADPDKSHCPCGGCGYALSEVDTWHECPIHHVAGEHHPEDECDCGETPCVNSAPTVPVMVPAVPTSYEDGDIPF